MYMVLLHLVKGEEFRLVGYVELFEDDGYLPAVGPGMAV
jgi:hypothetical protein